MSPRKPIDPEDDEEEDYTPPPTRLPAEVISVWERKRRVIQSKRDANLMWQPIVEGYRAYSESLKYAYDLDEWMR